MREVLLGYISNGTVRAEFMSSVLQELTQPEPSVGKLFDIHAGPVLTIARNVVAAGFLESDLDWLWMVDSDIAFSPGTLPALMKAADPDERPVVGALVRRERNGSATPAVWKFNPNPEGELVLEIQPPPGMLTQVAATSMSCVLIHRSAFLRITEKHPQDDRHWFAEMRLRGRQHLDAVSFGVRANSAGVGVYVHAGVQVAHIEALPVGRITTP